MAPDFTAESGSLDGQLRNCLDLNQWRRQDLQVRGGEQNYMKLSVVHKTTGNKTLNKDHVAETKLPQLLSQNTNMFGEATA